MMEAAPVGPPLAVDAPFPPLKVGRDIGGRLLASLLSLAVLAVSLVHLRHVSLHGMERLLPHAAGFWLLFAIYYLYPPVSEWIIFRRLWQVPAVGLLALIRKRVSNELLLGYSGEVYFYAWARRNLQMAATPFGAIKDVAILSAAIGNATTLVLLAATWPFLRALDIGLGGRTFALSVGVVVLSSLATLLFRRRLFSVPRADLKFIAAMQLSRVALTTLLAAFLWHMVLPGEPLVVWLLLSTLRLLVSRLPFVPNKDIVFAGLAAFLIGGHSGVADLMTLMAALILSSHVLLGAALSLSEMVGLEGRR